TKSANSQNQFIVTGLNGTKINNKTSQTFTGIPGDMTVNFKAGNDSLTIGSTTRPANDLSIPRNLLVNLGDGDNTFDMLFTNVGGDVDVHRGSAPANVSLPPRHT